MVKIKIIIIIIIINFSDFPNCNQKDYLNFYCNKCKKNLCKIHYHNEISCPFNKEKEENNNNKEFNYQIKKCDFCNINILNMEPIECPLCKGLFCLKHKMETSHNCKKREIKTTAQDNLQNYRELARKKIEEAKKRLKKK